MSINTSLSFERIQKDLLNKKGLVNTLMQGISDQAGKEVAPASPLKKVKNTQALPIQLVGMDSTRMNVEQKKVR